MAYAGSNNGTMKELADGLGVLTKPEEISKEFAQLLKEMKTDSVTLKTAQGLLIKEKDVVSEEYIKTVQDGFAGDVFYVSKDCAQAINKWVAKHTNDMIKELVSQNVDNITCALLNAVYFNGDWKEAFETFMTKSEPFTTASGDKVDVPMMHRSFKDRDVIELHTMTLFSLPYKGEEIDMIFALPKEGMKLDASELHEAMKNVYQHGACTVRTTIPKFKITYKTESFTENLKQMGISSIFDERSDLSGMTGGVNKGLYVSQIIHKAVIDVNEHGSEAAAATGMMLRCMAMPMMRPQVKVFTLNRPFYFFIRHRKTETILFCGHIDNPLSAN